MKGKWGYWEYNPNNFTLKFDKTVGGDHPYYEIDLEKCNTSAEVLDWIFQVKNKNWCSDQDIADLLSAFDDLMDFVQDKLCGGEIDQPFDFKKYLLDKRSKEAI